MRKLKVLMIWGFFCTLILNSVIICDAETEKVPELYSTSAVLMDADTGRVLYGKNENEPMAMASTTKIMTCILVLENGNMEDMVQVSSYAASMPKVKLSVRKNETYKVEDLLYSLMLESHNDSAVILAEYIGSMILPGDETLKEMGEHTADESRHAVAAFATLMNEKAESLGCEDTWFVTPNGLDGSSEVLLTDGSKVEKEHHTTARELGLILRYCIRESELAERFLQITRTPVYSFRANNRTFTCNNHNTFLKMMDGALTGKTGFTNKAGYCYVGALEKDGRTYIIALLACGWPDHKTYKWSDAKALMNYGMDNYEVRSITEGNEQLWEQNRKELPVVNGQMKVLGEPVNVTLGKAEGAFGVETLLMHRDEQVVAEIRQKDFLVAPVQEGAVVGYILYSVGGKVYRVDEIIAKESVDAVSSAWCLEQILLRFLPEL